MKPRKAVHFAIIIEKISGRVVRVFNPTYEYELDLHHVSNKENMIRLKKRKNGISRRNNGMTYADVYRLVNTYGTDA